MKEENSITNFKDNPYQYTRAIRFKVKQQQQSECFKKRLQWDKSQVDISTIAEDLSSLHTKLTKLFFYFNKKSEKLEFDKKLSVSKNWLKVWHKDIFHLSIKNKENKQGKYKLQELKDLHSSLEKWLYDWKKQADQLKKYSQQPKESQARHSDIAYIIRWFLNRQWLSYIQDFLKEAHTSDPSSDNQIKDLKNKLEQLQKELRSAEQDYLSSDSSGIEIAKASFNYYTVNKKPKDYYEDKLEQLEKERYEDYFTIIKNNHWYFWKNQEDFNQRNKIFFFKSDLEKEWLKRYIDKYNKDENNEYKIQGDLQSGIKLSLDQTYHTMKAFKAEQKSIFYEVMKHIPSKKSGSSYPINNQNHILKGYEINFEKLNFEGVNQTFSLFKFKDKQKYNEFIELTQRIEQEQDSQEKKDTAKKRGKEFLFGKRCYFTEYNQFCEKYKNVAQKRGRLIAQIKNTEKEKEEAKQTSYWSLVYVENDHKKLWLIPKDKMQKAKKGIDEFAKQDSNLENSYLYCFESLTMRALHKLCFAEESSFVEEMPRYLKDIQTNAKKINTDGDDQKLKEKDHKKLEFFKKVLNSDYAQNKLQLKSFKKLENVYKTEILEEFEKTLEKACYHIRTIPLNEEEKQKFIKNHDVTVLDITSYDLEGRNQNIYQIPHATSENKQHTDLWQMFWKHPDNTDKEASIKGFKFGEVRLNPEVKIRYRKADQNLQEYLENRGFNNEFKKHRKKFTQRNIQDQLTVTLTLALNAGNKYEDLAFSKPEDLCEKINDFNEKFNAKKDFKTAWKYGIDRGQTELATLCLTRFEPDKKKYQANNKAIPKPEFAQIECYTLKDYNHQIPFNNRKQREKTHRKAIDNLSYFIDDKSLFDIKPASCLDLTTAKVIKEKIVTNGDVKTYLKLKKVSAKRKLYELYGKEQIDSTAKLEWSKYKLEYKNSKESKQDHPEGVLNIKLREKKNKNNEIKKEETIYEYCIKYKDILSEKDIEKDLNRYLEELKSQNETHTPSILQINHLRDALTANIVGVISYLCKNDHTGFIILEDLDKGKTKENDNIHNRLEVALYNKFQSISLVPPHVKDIIQLREDVRKQQQIEKKKNKEFIPSSQIGAIVFVDEESTSKDCPYCETKQTHQEAMDEKFKQKRFRCQSCDFDTYAFIPESEKVKGYLPKVKPESYDKNFQFLKEIDNPDKVASYNIAKKIKDSKDIGKWKLSPSSQKKEETYNGQRRGSRDKSQRNKNQNQHNSSRNYSNQKYQEKSQQLSKELTGQFFKGLDVMIKQQKKVKKSIQSPSSKQNQNSRK